jgi:hypothetical protein
LRKHLSEQHLPKFVIRLPWRNGHQFGNTSSAYWAYLSLPPWLSSSATSCLRDTISLSDIEGAISQSFANFEFAAFAVSSDKWGQELHIAAVNAPDAFSERVTTLLVEKFGNAAKPKRFHQLTALPLIGIGKVDRGALAQLASKMEI